MKSRGGIRTSNIDLIVKGPPKKHTVVEDCSGEYLVQCKEKNANASLMKKPVYCPLCGEKIGH